MPIAYSYKRFSSDAQEGNDSIRRQTALAQRFVEQHPEYDLVLDTTLSLTDAGVSAFKGKNLREGALGLFVDAVAAGLVLPGSWLLLESFDRFTRQSVNIAAAALLNLINRGIVVVTLHNEVVYREEDFQGTEGLVNLLGALIAMEGHHREQVTKGKRVAEAWRSKYSKASKENHVLTSIVPFWLTVNSDRTGFDILEDKVAILREIYQRRANGEGKAKIARDLSQRGVPTPKGRTDIWHASTVEKLLNSDAPAGVFINSHGDRFEQYFPQVIDTDLFQVVKQLRSQLPSNGLGISAHGLTGLVKHDCGTTMRRVNKGNGSTVKLQCPRCNASLPFTKAVGLINDCLFNLQQVPSTSPKGLETLELEYSIDGLSLEVEDAFLEWRKTKTAAHRSQWERLTAELAQLRKALSDARSFSSEVVSRMEDQVLDNLFQGKISIFNAVRSVVTSISLSSDCSELTLRTISGKVSAFKDAEGPAL